MFEDFEGVKRIKNVKDMSLEDVYSILEKYQKEMGKITLEENRIVISVVGKYDIEIKVSSNVIKIERFLEKGMKPDENPTAQEGKPLEMAQADRMIEQIYDLINDYIPDEVITEKITSVKEVLTMEQTQQKKLFSMLVLGRFYVVNEKGEKVYEANQRIIDSEYIIKNSLTTLEEMVLNFSDFECNRYVISKGISDKYILEKDNTSNKTKFITSSSQKHSLKISADYTESSFLVEYDEIVIGAIDCLDPEKRTKYRIEVNDLDRKSLMIAITIMLDIYGENVDTEIWDK